MKTELTVKGFHCRSCELLVKDIAGDFPEITSCKVDVKKGKVALQHREGFDVGKFKKEVMGAGAYTFV